MLSQNIRNKIYKIPVIHKICQVIVDLNNLIYFKFKNKNKRLVDLKTSELPERCFIVGNGPSLKSEDLDKLVDEDCFGMNYIFKIFDKTCWRPKYYLTQDAYGVPVDLIKSADLTNILLGAYYCRKKGSLDDSYCFYHKYTPFSRKLKFSSNADKMVFNSPTVTYSAIQIAVYLGYKEIYFLGMDTDFPAILQEDGNIVNTPHKNSHFYEDKNPEKIIYNKNKILDSYLSAKEYCDSHNIKIFNATRGGKLEIFERVDFDSLFLNKTEE